MIGRNISECFDEIIMRHLARGHEAEARVDHELTVDAREERQDGIAWTTDLGNGLLGILPLSFEHIMYIILHYIQKDYDSEHNSMRHEEEKR